MEYEVGDVYGYRYAIIKKPFNPEYPGAPAQPRIVCEKYLTGKQTFYCLVLEEVLVEGVLLTEDDCIPMRLTWDGWEPLEDLSVYRDKKEAVIAADWDLHIAFERGEKFNC